MNYLKMPGRQWPAHDSEVKQLFGLDSKAKWPAEGLTTRSIQGIDCWVNPLGATAGFIRARCRCPACGNDMAIGRLAQHAKRVHAQEE